MKLDLSYAGIIRAVTTVIGVAMVLYHMWAIAFGSPEAVWFRGTHLLFAMVLSVPDLSHHRQGLRARRAFSTTYCWCSAAAPILYLFIYYDYIVNRIFYVDDLYPADKVMGVLMTLLVLEATRRVIGWVMPITAAAFLFYGLAIAQLEPQRMLDQLYMTTEGIFGIPLSVSATYVVIFIVFGDLHGAHRHRAAVHGFCHRAHRPCRRRTGQGGGGLVEPVRHDLRQRRRQCDGDGPDQHSADEAHRLSPGIRGRRRGGCLDRRTDHAADHGRCRLRHGGVHGRLLCARWCSGR